MQTNPDSPDFESKIIASFSKHVKSYDRHAHLQKSMGERLASYLPQTLPGTVIEIGCGTGVFTRHLLTQNVGRLILNDLAPAMLEYLRTQLKLPENTQFLAGNAEYIAFEEADLIVANAVFQWFHEPQNSLIRLAQSIKKKGHLIFSTFGPETLKEFRETASLDSPANLKSMDQWKRILRKGGFTLQECCVEKRNIFSPSTLTLVRNLQQIGAAPLPMMNPGGLRRLIRSYDEKYSTPQGVYSTWELFYFKATR
jgi:malonyl-CoA O-methyltransferase